MRLSEAFCRFSNLVAEASGKPATFVLAFAAILVWAITGPIFGFSETWQLVVNTGTTIITFLMVFILQNSQNRDSKALQAKLDELILTNAAAENRFIGIEKLNEEEIARLTEMLRQSADSHGDREVERKVSRLYDRKRSET